MNTKLLIDLRDALRILDSLQWKERGFDTSYWAKGKKPKTPKLGCGATCCAFGLGTTLPSWKKAGLRLTTTSNMLVDGYRLWVPDVEKATQTLDITPKKFFAIFHSKKGSSPGEVADQIDKSLNSR